MQKLSFILLIQVMLSSLNGFNQELPLFSNYTLNPLIYNPANAGSGNDVQTFLHHRTQWTGFKGAPVSHLFTMSAPISSINSGLGISIQNDQRGFFNTIQGSLKYAYHAKLNQKSSLSLGLGLDVQNRLLRIGESTVRDIEDPLVNNGSSSETFLDASFGIEYHFLEKLTVGFSIPQLLQNNAGKTDSYARNSRYYIGQASYLLKLSATQNIVLQPIVLARYNSNSPFQYDVNALVHYKDMFVCGLGYRSSYAVNMHLGANFKNLTFRYVYDFVTTNSNINSGLNHEITLGYKFGTKKEVIIQQVEVPTENTIEQQPSIEEKSPEELSKEKINQILYILIDDYLEKSYKFKAEEKENIRLLKDTIYNLLESLNKK